MSVVKIDGVDYDLDALSDEAKAQIAGIQAVDRRSADLREQLALLQAARNTYYLGLKGQLEGIPAVAAVEAAPAPATPAPETTN
jgi:hypothetical protein